jgi:mannose-6-phosphate isomerase
MPAWAGRLATMYPGNGGILVALLMHHVRLNPGQALYLGAGNVHAYLGGTGFEVMASSDNVVRAAFTQKNVNVDEFLHVANMNAIASPLIEAESVGAGTWQYPVATARFGTQRIDVSGTYDLRASHDTEILVCTAGNATSIQSGQAAVLRNGESVTLSGNATVFRTWGTH